MQYRIGPWAAAALVVGIASSRVVSAQATSQPSDSLSSSTLEKQTVTATLDQSRTQIAPSLGATAYTMGPDQIQSIPEGDNAPFQQVLLRMPGVVEDSFGQEHVRGEHANLTYRVNGVILPEPLNGFGQELDTHLIDSVSLIDGTLPAQFGFRTAGIVDVTTKTGSSLASDEVSIQGGSAGLIEPSFEFGRAWGKWDLFITGSMLQDGTGIENPTSSHIPIHDTTEQNRLFAYGSYHIDDTSRVSLLFNSSYSNFQIPNTPDLPQQDALNGVPFRDSSTLNERQNEQNCYGVLSYQKSVDDFSIQASGFLSYGGIDFQPDTAGDLIFQGVSGQVFNSFATAGFQLDTSYILNPQHTIRFGAIADDTDETLDTHTDVFPTDINGPTSDVPFLISADSTNHAISSGLYVQDEWRLTSALTLNYGIRYDRFDANFDTESQFSPRANLVWKVDPATTIHGGYARYFVPPPVQYVSPQNVAGFANTTNASENTLDSPPKVEKSDYYDVGISHQVTKPWTVSLDGFYKRAHNLVDNGQFGQAVIISPFNYSDGRVYGAEVSSTYKQDAWSAYGNFSWVETGGRDIDSNQYLIGNDELAYIQDHYIHLDHESEFSASAGTSYELTRNDLVYADVLYASGLRSGFANTTQEPYYYPINLGYQHIFHTGSSGRDQVKLRMDIINVLDNSIQLRDGSGIGVAAPQYAPRRTFILGIAYDF